MSLPLEEARFRAAGIVGGALVRALFRSVRFDVGGDEALNRLRREGQAVIFVLWHGQLLPLTYHHRDEGVTVLVSEHADGEYITRIIRRLGYQTARGSSTRGGAAGLRGLLRAAQTGRDLAITADGPRGPSRKVKLGALTAAKITGLPLVPVAASSSRAWILDSWDRFLVPRPFSTLRIRYGEPVYVDRRAGETEITELAERLEDTLSRLNPGPSRQP